MTQPPELLVFTLGPRAESRRHRLLAERDRKEEIGLRQECLEAAVAAGRVAGCRITVCSPLPLQLPLATSYLPQGGGSFGSRLERALEALFVRSTGPHLMVGTDVPDLAPRHLREALARLRDDPEAVVLGPSPDGGIYLLALGRPLAGLAHAVRWGSSHVLADLLELLRRERRPAFVLDDSLLDLDRPADLERWLHATPPDPCRWGALRRRLLRLLGLRRRLPAIPGRLSVLAPLRRFQAGRAPPSAAA